MLLEGFDRQHFTTLLTNWYRVTKGKFKVGPLPYVSAGAAA